jgi:uncharacterized protein GlcG (DUF336 family)
VAALWLHVVDLDLALAMCEAARAEASAHGALVSVAVVDGGGHLVAFQRMDGAEIAGPVLARDKAYTAVAHRAATAELQALVGERGDLTGMFAADGGRYVCFPGGVPLWSGVGPGRRVVGGIGVSGGTGEQDHAAAAAAAQLWQAHVEHDPAAQHQEATTP